jgi:glycosyltransferase involved in cell wall biosynthesis
MTKKRIAYIGIKGLPAKAGVDVVVQRIVASLDRERFEPTVYVSNREVPAGMVIPGVRIIRMPTVPGKFTNAPFIFLAAALHAFFFGNYDLINIHSVETSFILPLLRLRYRVISTAHGLVGLVPDEYNSWGAGKLFFKACEYPFMFLSNWRTSVSLPDKGYLEGKYGRDVHYIPNGVELPALKYDEARAFLTQHGLEPGNYLIFTAGRNIRRKGCHFALQALEGLGDDVRLLVLGDASFDPPYNEELLRLADHRVRFGGFVADKGLLFALIQMSCLFLFPTTYEAMANTLLEVAALKTPLIASDLPENRAVLPEQALFFKSADVADLRDKLIWALAHPREMSDLAAQAHAYVTANYQWPQIIAQYEANYEALLS